MSLPPTNPKKKSLMPSGELRRRLRGFAHSLNPVVQIGKEGVTSAVIRQVTGALHDHGLIKVKLGGDTPEDRFQAAERLGEEPGVNVVQILGRVIVLYKRHPQHPRYEGAKKKLSPEPAPRPAPAPRAAKRGGARPGRAGRRARS